MSEKILHIPVLLNEVLSLLNLAPDAVVVDGTLGAGGHARALLKNLGSSAKYIGLDQDKEMLSMTRLSFKDDERLSAYQSNYSEMRSLLLKEGIGPVDAVLLDLGVSSFQLDTASRGFSFAADGPLDMRMGQDQNDIETAADIVNLRSENELADLFYYFGEERFARRIAKFLVQRRCANPFLTTLDLAQVVENAVPKRHFQKIHPATRVFQALRIAVNRELEVLENFLSGPMDFIKVGGKLAVISFHSLEDRIVKHQFRKHSELEILTKKPLIASEEEIKQNPRSRSAKLRVAIKK